MKTKPAPRATKAAAKAPTIRARGKCLLRLFVAGATARSRQAILRVSELCANELQGAVSLK